MKKNYRLTKAIDTLLERIIAWKKSHRPRSPLQPELWHEAAELAQKHGIWKTARALRLDYTALKKRVEAGAPDHQAPSAPQFIEFFPPMAAPIAECALEVESIQGMKLRITMKNVGASELASIIRECAR
jgi:hypothetical protein